MTGMARTDTSQTVHAQAGLVANVTAYRFHCVGCTMAVCGGTVERKAVLQPSPGQSHALALAAHRNANHRRDRNSTTRVTLAASQHEGRPYAQIEGAFSNATTLARTRGRRCLKDQTIIDNHRWHLGCCLLSLFQMVALLNGFDSRI
jgi:hypothetical protein